MKQPISKWTGTILMIWALSLVSTGAAGLGKTLRVEHGKPVVLVSQRQVLLLEFLTDPTNALVSHASPDIRHCRGRYRYRLFEGSTGSLTDGSGTVEEILRTVSRTATGSMTEDAGSKTSLGAGEFGLWWSEATAGVRSWLYYRADSGIRFIQQPQHLPFDAVTPDLFRRYLTSKNVEEFAAAGQTVQVIGPAVFSGDWPTESPVSARIESCQVRDGRVELKLANLATNKSYVIESSYELKTGNWNVVHIFPGQQTGYTWSEPLAREITAAFFRIRERL